MNTRESIVTNDWDRREWASSPRATSIGASPRWTLWEWASVQRPRTAGDPGVGASALSGFGHNPSGQHWAEPELGPR
jgi:hypothetical protein